MAQLAHHDPLGDAEVRHLLDYLATISEPRALSGRRHPLVAILALAAAAVLTGARSMAAIAEWAVDAPRRSGRRLAPAARRPSTGPSRPRRPSAARWPVFVLPTYREPLEIPASWITSHSCK
jgi:DDE_Tnp_1-associated